MSALASVFTGEEISVVARITAMTQEISNSIEECEDCIKVIKEEKNKNNSQRPAEMNEEDFLSIFKDKSKINDNT